MYNGRQTWWRTLIHRQISVERLTAISVTFFLFIELSKECPTCHHVPPDQSDSVGRFSNGVTADYEKLTDRNQTWRAKHCYYVYRLYIGHPANIPTRY